ncbi:hypothetical protein SLEP1_g52463 [Rubroshorea leprosula]|uniref:AAA+ ATPase domain-containing protein n=1 Tax=Rubroshorea leprosula TaxID=152421 RepID=A0AAV5M909_9ROSI|nr:hypothetical protein SLEP1_g52463 [Rubroshorea leprosula]
MEIVTTLVISPILQEILSRATSFADGEIAKAWNLEKELLSLTKSLPKLQFMLEAAGKMVECNDTIRDWLRDLEDLAHELVSLLDECDYEATEQVHTFLPSFSFRRKMAGKIKEIEDFFHRGIQIIDVLNLLLTSLDVATPGQYPDDISEILGREHDLTEIISLLNTLSSKYPLSGLSIVGMPGVGKTTLARSIKKWAEEGNFYDLVAWVSVSKKFDEKKILEVMVEYLDGRAGGWNSYDAMLQHLRRMLENKKFLLILDDVCNELDAETWKRFISRLSNTFKASGNSSIVVTTSNKKVASTMDAVGCNRVPMIKHELQKLSNEECWLIMEKKVLSSSNLTSIKDPELAIGKAIAGQCGGLPLVADVIGEALSQHIDADKWSAIRDNTAWDSPHRKGILSKLKKSSDRLSLPLKKCFSYCSIFPKGSEIRRDEVVQLWMAKGFLFQHHGSKSDEQEDVGDRYLEDLVSNFLFQDVKMDEYGNIESFKMHDEMHNLALSLSTNETFIWPDTRPIDPSCIRHLRVMSNTNFSVLPEAIPARLHSLFLDADVFQTMVSKLSSLRSLKLAAAGKEDLEASLCTLKYYIKYLDISEVQEVPGFVTKLYNLQTLRVTGCRSLGELPTRIENLVRLRHIYFNDERHMPSSVGKLTALQTLQLFVVGEQKGRRIEELKCLNQLRGTLKICNLEEVASESEAMEAKLEEKVHLIKLQFLWSKCRRANRNIDESVLEQLRPHSNLKSLTLENYRGGNFPIWMLKNAPSTFDLFRLNNLVNLELFNCDECCNISCLRLLPELKFLHIRAMSNMEGIGSKFYHDTRERASRIRVRGQPITLFPALIKLVLENMTKLKEWIEEQGLVVFPCLEQLLIWDCPEFETWWIDGSASQKLSVLSILECPKLQVIPSGMLNLKSLNIEDCHNLKEYAQRDSPKWDNICHIPHIKINGEMVQSQDS